jgi:glucose-1-phosphate thymidylyltransferase
MTFNYLEGWWTDAGTFESLWRAANLVHDLRKQRSEFGSLVGADRE